MGILSDRFGPRPEPHDPALETTANPMLRAVAKLDAGMAGYVKTLDAAAYEAASRRLSAQATDQLMWQRSQAAWRALSDALLEIRTVLSNAAGVRP